MNKNETLAAVALATSAVTYTARKIANARRARKEKTLDIQMNTALELEAIRQAELIVANRIKSGHAYANAGAVAADLVNEMKFQSIAIREA